MLDLLSTIMSPQPTVMQIQVAHMVGLYAPVRDIMIPDMIEEPA